MKHDHRGVMSVRDRVAVAIGQRLGWKLMHPGPLADWEPCGYCRMGVPLYSVRCRWEKGEGEDTLAFLERYRRRGPQEPEDLALPIDQWLQRYLRQNYALPGDQWTVHYSCHFPGGDDEAIRVGLEEFASYHRDDLGPGPDALEIDRWVARIEDDESKEVYTL